MLPPKPKDLTHEELEAEDVWLRFFLRRLRLGLRKAKSPDNSSGTEGACCRRRATAGAANIVATQLS